MSSKLIRAVQVVALLAPAIGFAESGNSASGEVDFVDSRWSIVDAIAYPRDDGGWELQLASVPFDPAEVAEDGVVDGVDGMRLASAAGTFVLEIHITPDLSLGQAMVYRKGAGNGSSSALLASSLQLDQPPGERLVGRIDYRDEGEFIQARFDVAIAAPAATPAPSPETAPAATESGVESSPESALASVAPGSAAATLVAYGEAIEKRDVQALLQTMPPESREALGTFEDASHAAIFMNLVAASHPIRIEVTASTEHAPDQVELRFRGRLQDADVTGTAAVQRVDGTWYMLGLVVDPAP